VEAFASGATDLFTKPYHASELSFRVRILLERGRLIDRLTDFHRHFAEDLLQAAATQSALLPDQKTLAQLRAALPFDIAHHYEASVGVGGDIWGIEQIAPHRVMIFNADFAGHGVSAAFNTVRLHSFIHSSSGQHDTPSALLGCLNGFLCQVLPTGQYATMFCAILDLEARRIEYACAGSPPQLLRSRADRPFTVLSEPGFPLGITREASFETKQAPFEPGAMLLLFSDALIETPAPPDAVFDAEGLRDFLNAMPAGCSPHEVRSAILQQLFSNIREKPEDDLTLVAAHYFAPEEDRR
jgi:phosphoserine phosphatase RsbU/P